MLCGIALILAATGPALSAAEPTPVYRWSTFAGRATTGHDDGPATEARFNNPHGLALDASGNLYVADNANHTIRKITPQGIVSTFAGSPDQPGSADGTGSAARFHLPKGVAVDPNGNVYVADSGNHTVRKITPGGVVTTLAGLAGQSGSTDGTGSAARFSDPIRIFADAAGNVYVLQAGMRRIAPNGTVDTIPLTGTITTPSGTPVTVTATGCAAVDSGGQIYFAARPLQSDGSHGTTKRIVKRDLAGTLTVLASSDSADEKPHVSDYTTEIVMATDGAGSLYFVSQLVSSIIEHTLYRIAPDGTLAYVPWRGASRGGYADEPKGLVVGADGGATGRGQALGLGVETVGVRQIRVDPGPIRLRQAMNLDEADKPAAPQFRCDSAAFPLALRPSSRLNASRCRCRRSKTVRRLPGRSPWIQTGCR